jgi:hypothetical protein
MAAHRHKAGREHAQTKKHAKERPKKYADSHRREEPRSDEDVIIRQEQAEQSLDTPAVGPVYEEFRFLGAYNAT